MMIKMMMSMTTTMMTMMMAADEQMKGEEEGWGRGDAVVVDVGGTMAMEGGQMELDEVMDVVMDVVMGVVMDVMMASMHFSILSPTYSSKASGPETVILPIVVQADKDEGEPRPSSVASRTIDISINTSNTKQ